jgi:hypothetical protein
LPNLRPRALAAAIAALLRSEMRRASYSATAARMWMVKRFARDMSTATNSTPVSTKLAIRATLRARRSRRAMTSLARRPGRARALPSTSACRSSDRSRLRSIRRAACLDMSTHTAERRPVEPSSPAPIAVVVGSTPCNTRRQVGRSRQTPARCSKKGDVQCAHEVAPDRRGSPIASPRRTDATPPELSCNLSIGLSVAPPCQKKRADLTDASSDLVLRGPEPLARCRPLSELVDGLPGNSPD